MKHHYFEDEAAKEEELGPPGRVFLNRHPEISPDLRLYSRTEFPLRDDAAHCRLIKYLALPVFNNQYECIGVLELFEFSDSTLQVIENALKAAKLSSTHINYKPSFLGRHLPSNDVELQQLALTEIQEACKLFNEIPQLNKVEVWVHFVECPSINNTMSCMELIWATNNIQDLDLPMCKFQHAEAMKGIAGMALESKNRPCFCQNLCEFSIVKQPLAHFAQRHSQKHSDDKQGQFLPEESVTSFARAAHCNTSAANLKKKTKGIKRYREDITHEELESQRGKTRKAAAKVLDTSVATFRRRLKDFNMTWSRSISYKNNLSPLMSESANKSAPDSLQNMGLSSCSNLLPSDVPLYQNVPPKVDMVIIYAKCKDTNIKLRLCHSAGMEKLLKEVGTGLKLDVGTFELEYLDGAINERILLRRDADLELCLESLAAASKPYIQVFVKSI